MVGIVEGSAEGTVEGSVEGAVDCSVEGSVDNSVEGPVDGSIKGSVDISVEGSVKESGLHSSSPIEEMATAHVTSGERSWACIDIGVPERIHSSRFPRSCDVEANNVPCIIPRYVTC